MKLSEGFISIDEHGLIRACDSFAQAITGYLPAQIVGRNIGLLVRPEVGPPLEFDVAATSASNAVLVGLDVPNWVARDGRPLDVSIAPCEEAAGLLRLFSVTVRLRMPENAMTPRMADLFNRAAVPMHSSDSGGRIEYVNDAWLALLGYERDEVIGHESRDYFCDPLMWDEMRRQLHRDGEVHGFEALARRKDGRLVSLLIDITTARDSMGVQYTRTTLRDITDLRSLERCMRLKVHGAAAVAIAEALGPQHPKVLETIAKAADAECVGIWLPSNERGVLVPVNLWFSARLESTPFAVATRVISFASGVGMPGRTWQTGSAHVITDLRYDSNYLRQTEAISAGLTSGVAFPLFCDGRACGVVDAYSNEIMPRDPEILRELAHLGQMLGPLVCGPAALRA